MLPQDTENAEANFYRLQDTNGMDEHTFWRYHLKASKTKKFQYEIEVFEEWLNVFINVDHIGETII